MKVIIEIKNTPMTFKGRFVVARRAEDATLWYYGSYDTVERAVEVAEELGNGFVVEVNEE